MIDRTVFLGSTTQIIVRLPQGSTLAVVAHQRVHESTGTRRDSPSRSASLLIRLRVLASSGAQTPVERLRSPRDR